MPQHTLVGFFFLGCLFISYVWRSTRPASMRTTSALVEDKTKTGLRLVVLLIAQFISGLWFPWKIGSFTLPLQVLCMTLFVAGIGISVWAKLVMKEAWGSPAQLDTRRQKRLVTQGPFAFSRNPIYLGLGLMALAASIGMRSYFFPFVFLYLLHLQSIAKAEEAILRKHFGKQYLAYLKSTPRFL